MARLLTMVFCCIFSYFNSYLISSQLYISVIVFPFSVWGSLIIITPVRCLLRSPDFLLYAIHSSHLFARRFSAFAAECVAFTALCSTRIQGNIARCLSYGG